MKINEVIKSLSASNAAIKNTASPEPKEGWYPTYSASGQDVWLPDYRFEQKGIVVSAVGARCGKAFKADGKWNVCANTHPLSVDESIADRDYCWYMLNNEAWWIKGGTVQPFVKVKDSLSREHTFPPLEIQKKIVSELDQISSIIELRTKELQKLDELIKARFVEMFENSDYQAEKLGAVCKKITDGTHKTPTYLDEGITFISAKNIVNGELDFTDIKHISEEEYQEIQKRCQTAIGDILLSKSGSLGSPVIVKTEERIGLFESLAVLKYDREKLLPEFLCEQLKTDRIQRQFTTGTKGVAIKHLHLGVIADTDVIVPPLNEQKAFADFVKQLDKSKLIAQKGLEEAQLLFDSLMQKYFG